jgi:hypothetical protein
MSKRKIKQTDTYIAVLPCAGNDDEDVAIIGNSIDNVVEQIKDYLYETMEFDDDGIVSYMDDQDGIKIYKIMPGETTKIYAEVETKLNIIKESLA